MPRKTINVFPDFGATVEDLERLKMTPITDINTVTVMAWGGPLTDNLFWGEDSLAEAVERAEKVADAIPYCKVTIQANAVITVESTDDFQNRNMDSVEDDE